MISGLRLRIAVGLRAARARVPASNRQRRVQAHGLAIFWDVLSSRWQVAEPGENEVELVNQAENPMAGLQHLMTRPRQPGEVD